MKQYRFRLKSGEVFSFTVEDTRGMIVLNTFMPDYLKSYAVSPDGQQRFYAICRLEGHEFQEDCKRFISYFNAESLNYRDWQHCISALKSVTEYHCNKFGRILFDDLLTYAEELCVLMSAMGYNNSALKDFFPHLISIFVEYYGSFLKNNGMYDTPFSETKRYQLLKNNMPKFPILTIGE